jgi:hypothetical protein
MPRAAMKSGTLFVDDQENKNKQLPLSSGLFLEVFGGQGKKPTRETRYRQGVFVKSVDLNDRVAKRLFIVDAVDSDLVNSRSCPPSKDLIYALSAQNWTF